MLEVYSFCYNTDCLYSRIYDQSGHGNDLTPSVHNGPGVTCEGGGPYLCAAPFWIDPTTGLPAVATTYPTEYDHEPNSVGIRGGSNPVSVMMDGRNEETSQCCGAYGISHPVVSPDRVGTMLTMWWSYGVQNTRFMNCLLNTTFCAGIDEESANHDSADYDSSLQQDVIGLIKWDGASRTNTVTGVVNGTQIFANSPPYAQRHGASAGLNLGTALRLGAGGDNSQVDVIWREGLITNTAISASDEATARGNMTAFYAAQSPSACKSTADFAYYFPQAQQVSQSVSQPIGSTFIGWALRRMRASYYGPIVDLRDSTGTVSIYGPASSGCGLNPTAAIFCAANPPCTVSKLYNQGAWNSSNKGNVHDRLLDMTAVSTGAQPIVIFNNLNGQPTMHFSGTQELCSGNPRSNGPSAPPVNLAVVARRTGAFTTDQRAFSTYLGSTEIGFGKAASAAYFSVNGAGHGAATASDSTWHSLSWEAANGTTVNQYVDGAAAGGFTGSSYGRLLYGVTCIGGQPGGTHLITGDVAEVSMTSAQVSGSVGFASLEPTLFGLEKAAWGSLPH